MEFSKVFVVIDPDLSRSSQTALILGKMGKTHEARSREELDAIVAREKQIHALFVSVEVGLEVIRQLRLNYAIPIYCVGEIEPARWSEYLAAGAMEVFPFPFQIHWVEQRFKTAESATSLPNVSLPEPVKEWEQVKIDPNPQKNTMERIIVVGSVKGGEGKTTFVGQLGSLLAQMGYRPLGVDADPNGNLARFIGKVSLNSIADFGNEKFHKDAENLESMLVKHKTGFKVLPSPVNENTPVTWNMVESALLAYKPFYSLLLFDLAEGYTPPFEKLAKNYATDVFLLTTTDIWRVERTQSMAQKMINRGIHPDKIHVVVNKVRQAEDVQVVRAAFAKVGLEINVYNLPYHEGLSRASDSELKPALSDPKSPYAKEFRKLIEETLKISVTEPKAKGKKKKPKKAKFPFWLPKFLTR